MEEKFIKTELAFKVQGYRINEQKDGEPFSFQVQTVYKDGDKGLVKKTLKIEKLMTEDEIKKIVGKVIHTINAEEFKSGFKTYYKCKNFSIPPNQEELKPLFFDMQREISIVVSDIVKIKDTKDSKGKVVKAKDCKIQSEFKNGAAVGLFEIKMKDILFDQVKEFLGKEVIIKNVQISKSDFGTFYSSTSLPKLKTTK